MKLAKLWVVCSVIFVQAAVLIAQTAPNCESGWKPYGSYDGSHLDTVNLMNSNAMLRGQLTPNAPQRGSLKVSNSLYASSKDWQAVCNGLSWGWEKGGAGVIILPAPGLSVHRTRTIRSSRAP
jgi:hypothetical protein